MGKKIAEEEWTRWLPTQLPANPMPPGVRTEIHRILDDAARRLLNENLAHAAQKTLEKVIVSSASDKL
jgi:hypothetical protein